MYFSCMLKERKKIYVYMLMGDYLCVYILMGDYLYVYILMGDYLYVYIYIYIYTIAWLYIFTVCLKCSKILVIVYLFVWYLFQS